jgi:type IV/VI secretion system ImpK/VasF family protein
MEVDQTEVEAKTDEFEIVPPPEPPPSSVDDRTVSVEKPSTSFIRRIFGRGDTQVEKPAAQKASEASAVFLLTKFRAFYSEIIRFRHQKSEFAAGFATALMVTDYTADLSPSAAAEGLSKRLSELLELQFSEAKWMGGEAGDLYPEAQYAMAALADELFANIEWEGQSAWPQFSVEKKLFQSKAADVELFKRVDKLLKSRPDSPVARDLARVYLLVLAAGFQGKYRPFGLTRALAEYRQRLFEYIHDSDPLMLYAPERRIFPEAVSRTVAGQAISRFSTAQRWTAILVLLAAGYVAVAHFAWNRVSADLRDVTSRIKAGSTSGVR